MELGGRGTVLPCGADPSDTALAIQPAHPGQSARGALWRQFSRNAAVCGREADGGLLPAAVSRLGTSGGCAGRDVARTDQRPHWRAGTRSACHGGTSSDPWGPRLHSGRYGLAKRRGGGARGRDAIGPSVRQSRLPSLPSSRPCTAGRDRVGQLFGLSVASADPWFSSCRGPCACFDDGEPGGRRREPATGLGELEMGRATFSPASGGPATVASCACPRRCRDRRLCIGRAHDQRLSRPDVAGCSCHARIRVFLAADLSQMYRRPG